MNPPSPREFCWNELVSSNVAGSAAFYTKLLGWTAEEMPGSDGSYTLFMKDGTMAAGLMARPKEGIPTHWLPYVAVDDCDASTAQAVALGAEICAPPMDISVGRIAVLKDPQGAVFGLFKPGM